MAEANRDRYALGRLILDYLRAFMWPAVVAVVVLVYRDDVLQILKEREVDIFGLRIGKQVADIEQKTMAEIADIRLLLEQQRGRTGSGASEIVEDIDTKLGSLERNLNREITQIQQAQTQLPPPSFRTTEQASAKAERAAAAERRGFEAILKRNVAEAIAAFEDAYAIWPVFHNVEEILKSLQAARESLSAPDSPAWAQLYRTILTRYSWGVPEDLRPRFRQQAVAAY